MADLTCKQNFFCRNFSSQRTCVSNSTAPTLTQDISFESYDCMRPIELGICEGGEGEEYTKYHEALLATMGDYLLSNIPIYQSITD